MLKGAEDIHEGNLKLILAVLWALIQRYQIAEGEPQTRQSNAKKRLLAWVNACLPENNIKNFTTDWNDGRNLSALVDYCKPGLIPNHATLDPNDRLENVTKAMDIAEQELNIPQVLHPEDLAVYYPDEMSVMTYISGYCRQYSPGQNALLEWINQRIPNCPATNFTTDWSDGQRLGALIDSVARGNFPEADQMKDDDGLKNCQDAMDAAHNLLGIEQTIPPKEFAEESLDQLTRMTYLTQFRFAKPRDSGTNTASAIKAVGPGITGDTVNQPTTFLLSAPRIPVWADVDVKVINPDGFEIPVEKKNTNSQEILYFYTPDTVGEYLVDIKLNNTPIPNSPFHVSHMPPSNPQQCFAGGYGLSKAHVGETFRFSVNCEQGGRGELSVEMQSPSGYVATDVIEVKRHNYSVSFTPLEPGEHKVSIKWDEKPIRDSPFTCIVTNPKKCSASGYGLADASVGSPQQFKIRALEAGPGKLSANIKSSIGDVPVEIQDEGNSNFTCTYCPQDEGPHTLNVRWSDIPIPGSPFNVNVISLSDPSKCIVSDLPEGRLRVSNTYSFKMDTSEAGIGDLTASAYGTSTPESCTMKVISNNVYMLKFKPTRVGSLYVEASYANFPIPGSPFKFTVNDPRKVKVNRAAGSYQVEQPIEFQVSTQNAGVGDLSASVCGPDGEKCVKMMYQGDKNHLIHFVPSVSGLHTIDIQFDEENVPQTPIQIFVEAGSMPDKVTVTRPAHTSKNEAYIIEHAYTYEVDTIFAGRGTLTVTSSGACTGQKPKVNVVDDGNGLYTVSVEAEEPDTYLLDIQWDAKDVPGSPYTLFIEDKPRPEKVVYIGPQYEVGSSAPITLYVNTENAGAGKLDATCLGKEVGPVSTEITEHEPKKYVVSFSPPKFDIYSISVLWSSENVMNSPFTVNIIPPDASKCIVVGPEIPDNSTDPIVAHVDASNAGNGKLAASAVGDTIGEVEVNVKETEPNKFNISYMPADNENYTLNVTWSDKVVPGSPFKVKSTTPNANKVFICESPPTRLKVGQSISLCFDVSEAGRGELTAVCKGKRVGEIPVTILQQSVLKNKFDVCFTPPACDVFTITVSWAGKLIKESPYTFNLMPIDVNKVKVIGPTMPQGLEGPIELMLQAAGAGKGKVTVACIGLKSGEVNVNIKETSTDIYQLKFLPPHPDIYTLAVQYDGQNIIGSPFLICTQPPNAGNVRVTEPDTIDISKSLHFKVDAIDAGNGKLKANCHGERYGQVQLNTIEENTALYDVSFTPHHADHYSVTIEWEGEEVPNSPFSIDLRPPMADKVKVGELHIPEEAGTGERIWMNIDCSDAGHGPVKAEAHGDLSGTITVEVHRKERAKYHLEFPTKQADVYHFNIFYGSQQVLETLYAINLTQSRLSPVKNIRTEIPEIEGDMVSLFFTTDESKEGNLMADIAGETSGAVPTKVTEISPSEYQVTFVPDKPEVYDVVILWSGKPIKGSPFKVDTRPAIHPDLVECGQLTYTDVFTPVELQVDIHKAGPGKLTASCVDDSGSTVPTEVKCSGSPGLYSVSFVPNAHGNYNLSVFFEGTEVKSSPFKVDIRPAIHPDLVECGQLTYTDVFKPAELQVDIHKAGPGKLTASCVDDSGSTVPTEVKCSGSPGLYSVSFVPNAHGNYHLSVFFEGTEVKSSPFKVDIRPAIHPDLVECGQLTYTDVFKPAELQVDIHKAGPGKLTASCVDDSGSTLPTEVKCSGSPGLYSVSFVPKAHGNYCLSVFFEGTEVKGSPFKINTRPAIHPDLVECGQLTYTDVFNPVELPVDIHNAGPGQITANCVDERGSTLPTEVKRTSSPNLYSVSFTPQSHGKHNLSVFFEGAELECSPLPIDIKPKLETAEAKIQPPMKSLDISMSATSSEDIDEVFSPELTPYARRSLGSISEEYTDHDSHLTAHTRGRSYSDQYRQYTQSSEKIAGIVSRRSDSSLSVLFNLSFNLTSAQQQRMISLPKKVSTCRIIDLDKVPNIKYVNTPIFFGVDSKNAGNGSLTVTSDGPSMEDNPTVLEVTEDENDREIYHIKYVPTAIGEHTIHLMWSGEKLPESPIVFNVNFSRYPFGEPVSLEIDADCKLGHLEAVAIHQPTKMEHKVKVARLYKGKFTLTFEPKQTGRFKVHVRVKKTEIPGSPYQIDIYKQSDSPPPVHVGRLSIQDPNSIGVKIVDEDLDIFDSPLPFGEPIMFSISTKEAGPGNIDITSKGPGKADVKVFDNKNATYTCEFTPSLPGKYEIDIRWNGELIRGCPYPLTFRSDTESSIITGNGLDLEYENFRVGVPYRFKLHCDEIGDGVLEIKCNPPTGARVFLNQIEDTDLYQCEIIPLEVGYFQIMLQFNDQHVLGSPFSVRFEQCGDASKCHMVESTSENQQDSVRFCISTAGAGRGKLTASVENINAVEWVPVAITQTADDNYNVEFNPADGAEYFLNVKYDDQHIFGSPFTLVSGTPGIDTSVASSRSSLDYPLEMRSVTPCKPERVKAFGPGLCDGIVGQEGNFTVGTAEGGSGTLQVNVRGPKGAFKIHMRRHPENERTILARYDPNQIGKYNIDIMWSETHIPGSPFEVNVAEQ